MANTKTAALIERLLQRTREEKITWERTVDEGVFRATFGGYSIALVPTRTNDGWGGFTHNVLVQLFNEEGVLIEEISGETVESLVSQDMKELYELARRQAMGVDKAIDTLLSELGTQ